MKINLFLFLLIASTCFLCSGCRREGVPLCVTYEVKGYGSRPYRMAIHYHSDTGRVSIDTTAGLWSKQICLPVGQPAILMAHPMCDPYLSEQDAELGDAFAYTEVLVSTAIVHDRKTVKNWGVGSTVEALLSPMDVDDNPFPFLFPTTYFNRKGELLDN